MLDRGLSFFVEPTSNLGLQWLPLLCSAPQREYASELRLARQLLHGHGTHQGES